ATYRKFELNQWLPEFKSDPAPPEQPHAWICTGKIGYRGPTAIQRDIANFKSALEGHRFADAFMPCAAPCSVQIFAPSDAYKTEEEYIYAVADALRHEYRAVVDAGLMLQLDDAVLPMHFNPNEGLKSYLAWARIRIEATNHALKGIPRDRVRYHIC